MVSLTKQERAKAKVVFATLITALCFKNVAEEAGADQTNMLAIKSMEKLIDELILTVEEGGKRDKLIELVQTGRIRFNKRVNHLDKGSAFLAALDVFTGDTFKPKVGTRFDHIRQTLKKGKTFVTDSIPHRKESVDLFVKEFRKAVLSL